MLVEVNLTITATQIPTISLSPTNLAFSAVQGGSNPAAGQTVTVNNSGTGTLTWSVSTTASWLSLSQVSGTAPSSFTATANVSGLGAGTYSSAITVTGSGATNTPQSIPVTNCYTNPARQRFSVQRTENRSPPLHFRYHTRLRKPVLRVQTHLRQTLFSATFSPRRNTTISSRSIALRLFPRTFPTAG